MPRWYHIPLAHDYDGIAFNRARRRKETTYPELLARNGRVRLVVLAIETGGRWQIEGIEFIRMLAKAKVRELPTPLQAAAEKSWTRRWTNCWACAAQRAVALSLLELPAEQGHNLDGHLPFLTDLLCESRFER